jgi:hypothetical protein
MVKVFRNQSLKVKAFIAASALSLALVGGVTTVDAAGTVTCQVQIGGSTSTSRGTGSCSSATSATINGVTSSGSARFVNGVATCSATANGTTRTQSGATCSVTNGSVTASVSR